MGVLHAVEISPAGYRSLRELGDKKVAREIAKVIDGLSRRPDDQGKALMGPLEGLRSVRACRDRYRVLYKVDSSQRRVSVLLIGRRDPGRETDVYAVARKLLKTLLT